jgi:Tetrapyrrole (Corrin/Porphyrin) Methylases
LVASRSNYLAHEQRLRLTLLLAGLNSTIVDKKSAAGCGGGGHERFGKFGLCRDRHDAGLTHHSAGEVCGAFYGHPGVFAWPTHKAIEIARREGYRAHMEPGVSAEDCLYADLGIDPGKFGCQHYEASQFMFNRRRVDTSSYLVLWQVGVAGDQSFARFATGAAYRQVLIDVLSRDYDLDHEAIIYRAATLPVDRPRIEQIALGKLAGADIDMHATLVIPPASALQPDQQILARLAALDLAADS